MIRSIIKYFLLTFLFLLLTVLTQIGGLILILSLIISEKIKVKNRVKKVGLFIGLYLACSFVIVPPLAKVFGRTALPISNKGLIIPNHIWTCLFNRHYVKLELYDLIREVSSRLYNENDYQFRIRYLDANFPFINGFPLLPHRSHDDGEKLDLAFIYVDQIQDKYWNDRVSFIGYGFCEEPLRGEQNMPKQCAQKGYWQYSLLTKSFGLASKDKVQFDKSANTLLVKQLSKHPSTKKIFIEPHLKSRLGFESDPKVRFHGCAAVRHDDHIHLEL